MSTERGLGRGDSECLLVPGWSWWLIGSYPAQELGSGVEYVAEAGEDYREKLSVCWNFR